MKATGPSSQTYFSQRLRLHYADWGNADAPPLILVHGGEDHCRSWDWIASELQDDWHVIAPDLRGHGDSQWTADGNYPIMNFVYDLSQLVEQFGYDQVTIVSHSLGGNTALRYAGLYPEKVRKIVAIESAEGEAVSLSWMNAWVNVGSTPSSSVDRIFSLGIGAL